MYGVLGFIISGVLVFAGFDFKKTLALVFLFIVVPGIIIDWSNTKEK